MKEAFERLMAYVAEVKQEEWTEELDAQFKTMREMAEEE